MTDDRSRKMVQPRKMEYTTKEFRCYKDETSKAQRPEFRIKKTSTERKNQSTQHYSQSNAIVNKICMNIFKGNITHKLFRLTVPNRIM
jgi:hypothetical protein